MHYNLLVLENDFNIVVLDVLLELLSGVVVVLMHSHAVQSVVTHKIHLALSLMVNHLTIDIAKFLVLVLGLLGDELVELKSVKLELLVVIVLLEVIIKRVGINEIVSLFGALED